MELADNTIVITYGSFTVERGIQVMERPVETPPDEEPPEEEKKGCRSEQTGIYAAIAAALLGAAVCVTVAVKRRKDR